MTKHVRGVEILCLWKKALRPLQGAGLLLCAGVLAIAGATGANAADTAHAAKPMAAMHSVLPEPCRPAKGTDASSHSACPPSGGKPGMAVSEQGSSKLPPAKRHKGK